jgi:hypothetical protein
MAIIYSYPTTTPIGTDTIIGTRQAVDETGDNLTVTFTVASITDKTFDFIQAVPSKVWNINHNLDKYPSVSVVNNNDVLMHGEVTYIDKNNLIVSFSAGFSGKAFLN